jgi:DNA-binding NtrC family response regulator
VGLFEEAAGGTLFLDEVGEMPLPLQAKLLRVLEIRQFRRVGGSRTRVFAARVVSATNRPLNSSLTGAMRPDLFFRLAGYAIRVPPLVERLEDVPELVAHFLTDFGRRHQFGHITLGKGALDGLLNHPWPGNIRELRAVVENAAIVARGGLIGRADIELALKARGGGIELDSWTGPAVAAVADEPPDGPSTQISSVMKVVKPEASGGPQRSPSLPDLQRDMILRAFEDSQHNLSKAAADLGIPRSTLRARLRRYGVR